MMKSQENIPILNAVCEVCGSNFTCGANDIEHCFCSKVILPKEIIEQIQNKYSHCLCEVCLQNWKQEENE